jgi:hypothetical protein
VEGNLELKENGEGGHKHYTLCLDTVVLWTKDADGTACPSALPFSLALPTEFEHEGQSYVCEFKLSRTADLSPSALFQPLPPSYSIKLKGLPGFSATIDVRSFPRSRYAF